MGEVFETQSFALVEMDRNVERSPAKKQARRFLDFSVGGEALYPTVFAAGYDNITPLWLDPSLAREVGQAIDRLLGVAPADAPSDRVSVYICSECGDLGCGALTVKLSIDEDLASWTDWGYQNNYEDTIHPVTSRQLGDMHFSRAEYDRALEAARLRITGGS